MNKKVKDLLVLVRDIHKSGALNFPLKDIEVLLVERYGFDVPRVVKPKMDYLLDRKILKPVNKKVQIYCINLVLLGDLLADDKLVKEGEQRVAKEKADAKAHVEVIVGGEVVGN